MAKLQTALNYDRRAHERVPVSAAGRVWYGPGLVLWADCKLRDLSVAGARIQIPSIYKLPSRLILAHALDKAIFEAIVKWQRGDAVGLSFELRHDLASCQEPRLAHVVEAWRALQGIA